MFNFILTCAWNFMDLLIIILSHALAIRFQQVNQRLLSLKGKVSRFLTQVTSDDLALTGCKFFSVTRSLMLTIAGTIVTYEIVLVQFNAVTGDSSVDNSTRPCHFLH
uniref:Gustatory receptor for sugar taste 64f n=1 Tax=Cacopsylla melanoneura TaxID=428564 RepID=A0A8D9AWY0_9HEMI